MKFTTVSMIALAALLPLAGTAWAADAPATTQSPTKAAPAETKETFISHMGARVLAVLQDNKKGFAQKQATLRSLFTEVVDTDWIARFVLGASWKTATPDQKEKYTELYRTYLTETYISKFDEDAGSKVKDIKVKSVKEGTNGTFTAHTEILQTGDDPVVKVDYLIRQKEDHFKVIDITIEGVSLLTTHRQEFSALASSSGMDGVIQKLTQLTTHKE